MKSAPVYPVAFSYIRFSHPQQAKGDSLRRQAEAAAEWCRRHGTTLDTTTTLHDLGKSAYAKPRKERGVEDPMAAFIEPENLVNPDRRALAGFQALIKQRKIPRGAYLIIENLDRLSRDDVVPATHLLTGILLAGVRIVQLKPAEQVLTDKSDGYAIMMAVMELSRGHGESAMKSERVTAAWRDKKRRGREDGSTITRRLPAWVEERGGKRRLIPARAAVVKRIFELAASGYGLSSIVRRLTDENVPPFGRSGSWVRCYVANILKDRRALGELQPRTRYGREADGPAIPDYFPAVVGEDLWLAARAGAAQRWNKPGRLMADHVHVFSRLLRHARDGDVFSSSMQGSWVGPKGRQRSMRRVLRNKASMEGRGPCVTFPLEFFERAVLSKLAEIDPHDIINGERAPHESLVLAGELERVKQSIAAIVADMDANGESPVLFRRLRDKEEEQRQLSSRLAEAQQKEAHPLSEAWGECQSLLSALDAAPDPRDARLRLRAAVRRIVESVWLLVVPRGRTKLCAVQLWFAGGEKHRDYLIAFRSQADKVASRTGEQCLVRALADVAALGPLDLRNPGQARKLEAALAAVPLDHLMTLMTPADG
jgi:DNA invertase Pin-like site-specific DNA recombinase